MLTNHIKQDLDLAKNLSFKIEEMNPFPIQHISFHPRKRELRKRDIFKAHLENCGKPLIPAFNCPGNLKHVVIPLIVRDTRWFKSP